MLRTTPSKFSLASVAACLADTPVSASSFPGVDVVSKTPFAVRNDYSYQDRTLGRAAVIALLRAHGVEVEFTT